MQSPLVLANQIHSRAVDASTRYRRAEGELIEALQQVEEHRVFLERGHSSLFNYVVTELGLAENIAYTLITVARKAREVPELKVGIQTGAITLSNARRIAPVLTPQNQKEWLEKASLLSSRKLEKEVVRVRPQERTPERASYVTPERVELKVGLDEWTMLRLRRAQDLLSQAKRRSVSLEETLAVLSSEFLRRNDPVEKAKRHQVRKGTASGTASQPSPSDSVRKQVSRRVPPKREPIPAALSHAVNLRDLRRCTHLLKNGSRCSSTRWIEIHHRTLVSSGGQNTLENLTTLCSAHHRFLHLQQSRLHKSAS